MRSSQSFASQWKARRRSANGCRSRSVIHALVVVLIAWLVQKSRHGIRELARTKPDLQRALPILDLPVSTAFVLSVLGSPLIYPQAPRLLQAALGQPCSDPNHCHSATAFRPEFGADSLLAGYHVLS